MQAILLLLAGCSSPAGPIPVDARAMYGAPEIPRPTLLRQADARFIENAAREFAGDRKLASLSWTGQGDLRPHVHGGPSHGRSL